MAAAVTLALLVIFCGISEYFRLQIIAVGVRDALEDAIISVVNDNYAGVFTHEKHFIDWRRPLRTAYRYAIISAGASDHGSRYKRRTDQ